MSKKPFEFEKCKTCQQELWSFNGLNFKVDDSFHYCSKCAEKMGGVPCCWCHKKVNLNYYGSKGEAAGIFHGSNWDRIIDASTVCCIDCLRRIENKRGVSNNGGWKNCETPNCRFTLSPNEEATGFRECFHCRQNERNKKQAERNKEAEQEFEKYKQIQQQAQNWWSALSPQERERECERLVENMKQGKYWASCIKESEGSGWTRDGSLWIIKNGKFTSQSPHLVPIQVVEEFMEKEIGFRDNKMIEWYDSQIVKVEKDNNPPNPPLKIENGEKSKKKKIEIITNDNEINLVIDIERTEKITLENDRLRIRFSITYNNQSSLASLLLTSEQVNNSRELQKVKNYLQGTNKSVLNQQELSRLFDTNSIPTETPKNTNKFLWIGGVVSLLSGLVGWLIMISKRNKKKH